MKFTILIALALTLQGQDWPQWRGPSRDGVARGVSMTATWPEALQQKWKAPVGAGYSAPVVSGGAVFALTREGSDEFLTKIDLATGKQIWRVTYAAPFKRNQFIPAELSHGPHSTPAIADGRIYTLGASSILSCFDIHDGHVVWRKDFSKQVDNSNLFTTSATSPLIDSGMLIIAIGDDRGGSVIAFDAATGKEKWTTKDDGPGYASPIVVDLAGTRQWVNLTTSSIVGIAVATGKLLWSLPYKDEYHENIVTPVLYKDLLLFSGVRKPTTAVKVKHAADKWTADNAWISSEVSMYMSSPVLEGDFLYGFSSLKKGQFFCLDARTGKTQWTSPGREATQASVVAVGDVLLALTDAADLVVIRKFPKAFERIAHFEVSQSATYASLVPLNHRILVKDVNSLILWQVD